MQTNSQWEIGHALSVFLCGYLHPDVVVRAKDFPCCYFLFLHLLPAHLMLLNLHLREGKALFFKDSSEYTSPSFPDLSEVLTKHNCCLLPLCELGPPRLPYLICVFPHSTPSSHHHHQDTDNVVVFIVLISKHRTCK